MLVVVLEHAPRGVKGPSKLSTGPASGEGTVGEGQQHASVLFFDLSPGLASNGMPRILSGVYGCISRSFYFPFCSGDEYGGNVADRLRAGSFGMSIWVVWDRALRAVNAW